MNVLRKWRSPLRRWLMMRRRGEGEAKGKPQVTAPTEPRTQRHAHHLLKDKLEMLPSIFAGLVSCFIASNHHKCCLPLPHACPSLASLSHHHRRAGALVCHASAIASHHDGHWQEG